MRHRKKNSRQRGSTTHGWGSMKKHRGAGNRGGVGNAGTGKRGDAKKPRIWKTRYFGKRGFKTYGKKIQEITTQSVELNKDLWVTNEVAKKENDVYMIDLTKMDIGKLVSKGSVKSKLKITVAEASAGAVEKIKQAGGEVHSE